MFVPGRSKIARLRHVQPRHRSVVAAQDFVVIQATVADPLRTKFAGIFAASTEFAAAIDALSSGSGQGRIVELGTNFRRSR